MRRFKDHEAPPFEPFKYRAYFIGRNKEMRLCDRCLRHHKRCFDSRKNFVNWTKSWKAHRHTQYK